MSGIVLGRNQGAEEIYGSRQRDGKQKVKSEKGWICP